MSRNTKNQLEKQHDTPSPAHYEEVIQGRIAEPLDWFYVQWGMESVKRNLQLLNESLARMVVLSSSLIGGGLYFIKDDMIPRGPKALTLLLFVGCLERLSRNMGLGR